MNAGGEFLFWILLFGFIALILIVHWVGCQVIKLRDARREISRLCLEVTQYRAWMPFGPDNWQVSDGRVRFP